MSAPAEENPAQASVPDGPRNENADSADNADNTEARWRGVAAEDAEDPDAELSLRLQRRSRALLVDLLRPRVRRAVLALLLVIAQNLAELSGPLLIAGALDVGVPAALDGRTLPLALFVGGYVLAGVAAAGLRSAFLLVSGKLGQDVVAELRNRLFRHAQRLSLSFHEGYTSGKVIARLTSDVDSLNDMLRMGLDEFFAAMLSALGISVVMFFLDPGLAVLALAGFVPLLVLTRWFYRSSRTHYRGTRTSIAKVIVQFVETMSGIRAVQAYRRERRNADIMGSFTDEFATANMRALRTVGWFTSGVRLIGNLALALVLLVGALRVLDHGLELGVLTAFLLYLRRFYDPMDQLAMFANAYSSATAALEKISGVLQERPGVAEPAHPVALPPGAAEVAFDDVRFAYSPDTPQVLGPVALRIPAGQTVAIVGATGAGKSTLAKLAARFYDPVSGVVRLAGTDLREVADDDLRRAVITVTQESFLFSGSVADNIALGNPDADRAAIESAAASVGAHEFITALPQGYDTDVRKRGSRLSDGQRQLIAFARAMLADPGVLILDEATSSLDIPTERAVQAALETVLADRTALIIAHRLSTVLIADRVLVVDGGRVTEDGAPAELVRDGGAFSALYRNWLASLA